MEFPIVSALLLFLFGAFHDTWQCFVIVQRLEDVAREGARIGSNLPLLQATDDPRVLDAVLFRVRDGLPAQMQLSVHSSRHNSKENLTNSEGTTCDEQLTVNLVADLQLGYLGMIGLRAHKFERSVTMRYVQQPLCDGTI